MKTEPTFKVQTKIQNFETLNSNSNDMSKVLLVEHWYTKSHTFYNSLMIIFNGVSQYKFDTEENEKISVIFRNNEKIALSCIDIGHEWTFTYMYTDWNDISGYIHP